MKYKLYVDGQLGLPFANADDARAAAETFQQDGYDTFIACELDDAKNSTRESGVDNAK